MGLRTPASRNDIASCSLTTAKPETSARESSAEATLVTPVPYPLFLITAKIGRSRGGPRWKTRSASLASTIQRVTSPELVIASPDTEAIEKALHRVGGIRRICDEDDRAAPGAKSR